MSDVLEQKTLDFTFVDNDTGEVIKQYQSIVYSNEANFHTQDFVSDKLLSSYIASFKRGCIKHNNITLQISYNESTVF